MKEKEKSKDSEKEKLKKRAPSKKMKAISKRSAKIISKVSDDEPEGDLKGEDPEDDDAEPLDIEPDEDEDLEPEVDLEDVVEEEEEELPPKVAKSRRSGRLAAVGKNGDEPAKPQTRLGLIRIRHESMKREIEQIREDLDSDEEE